MTLYKRQNYKNRNEVSDCQELGSWERDALQRSMSGLSGFYVINVVVTTQLYIFVKTRKCTLKRINFTGCKLYLNKPYF